MYTDDVCCMYIILYMYRSIEKYGNGKGDEKELSA